MRTITCIAVSVFIGVAPGIVAGELEPPSPPAPTMKTLDEVAVGTAISVAPYTISRPGFYYLSENLTMSSSGTAIRIEAPDVVLDLKGFTIDGSWVGTAGVEVVADVSVYLFRIEVSNGSITRFNGDGINALAGAGSSKLFHDLVLSNNLGTGIRTSAGHVSVRDCHVINNGQEGISIGGQSLIVNNIVSFNGGTGVSVGQGGSRIVGNVVHGNSRSGIYTVGGATVDGNTVSGNNGLDLPIAGGISVGQACDVRGNTLSGNRQSNIVVQGSGSSIVGNLLADTSAFEPDYVRGIYFQASGNFYSNNRSSGCDVAFDLGSTTQTDGGGNTEF